MQGAREHDMLTDADINHAFAFDERIGIAAFDFELRREQSSPGADGASKGARFVLDAGCELQRVPGAITLGGRVFDNAGDRLAWLRADNDLAGALGAESKCEAVGQPDFVLTRIVVDNWFADQRVELRPQRPAIQDCGKFSRIGCLAQRTLWRTQRAATIRLFQLAPLPSASAPAEWDPGLLNDPPDPRQWRGKHPVS